MSAIVQVCIVIVTIAICVMAFMAIRLMLRIDALTQAVADGFAHTQEVLGSLQRTSNRIHAMLDSLEPAVDSIRGSTEIVHGVISRAGRMSETMLDEIEGPMKGTLALMNGLRTGARFLLDRWSTRSHNGNHQHNRGGLNV